MPLNKTLEEAYDVVVHDINNNYVTDYTYNVDDITIDMSETDVIDISSVYSDTLTITGDNADNIFNNINLNTPWEDFCEYAGLDKEQSVENFREMCDRYPALEKALQQFKNTYNMVKDDWYWEIRQP